MGAIVVFTGLLAAIALFCFLRFQPEVPKKETLSLINWSFLGITAFLCGIYVLNIRVQTVGTPDENWFAPLALTGSFIIIFLSLTAGWIVRWWIFRPPSRPGSGFFG